MCFISPAPSSAHEPIPRPPAWWPSPNTSAELDLGSSRYHGSPAEKIPRLDAFPPLLCCHRNASALQNCPSGLKAFLTLKYLELHTSQEQNLLLMKFKAVSQHLEAVRRKEKNHLGVLENFQGCLSSVQKMDPNRWPNLGEHPHPFTSALFFSFSKFIKSSRVQRARLSCKRSSSAASSVHGYRTECHWWFSDHLRYGTVKISKWYTTTTYHYPRKFRRQISDLWTDGATVVRIVREMKESEKRESVKKKITEEKESEKRGQEERRSKCAKR